MHKIPEINRIVTKSCGSTGEQNVLIAFMKDPYIKKQ